MSTELVASLGTNDFQRETDLGTDPELVVLQGVAAPGAAPVTGAYRGLSLPRLLISNNKAYGYVSLFRIPLNLTVGTGLTFTLLLTDDGNSAADLGKVVYVGLTAKYMAAGAVNSADAGTGVTEEFASCTLRSTTNQMSITALAITNAQMNTAIAGGMILLRVRRLATNAADTCLGRAILLRVEVANT